MCSCIQAQLTSLELRLREVLEQQRQRPEQQRQRRSCCKLERHRSVRNRKHRKPERRSSEQQRSCCKERRSLVRHSLELRRSTSEP